MDEKVSNIDQKYRFLEKRNKEDVVNLENTIGELLKTQDQIRQSIKVIESTVLTHKKRLETMDMNRYLLLEDFAVFTQSKLPDQLGDTKVQIVEEMSQQLEEKQSTYARVQEEKLDTLWREVEGKLTEAMDSVSGKIETKVTELKTEMKQELQREIQMKEANMTGQLEKSKQEFLKAINGNMKVLDNLIGDYTTKTHE